jgi:hypothetical protein
VNGLPRVDELLEDPDVPEQTRSVARVGAELYEQASSAGISARLIGSLAVQLRCPRFRRLAPALGRRPSQDVDLVSYSAHERAIESMFATSRWTLHPGVRHSREYGVKRLIYTAPDGGAKVDIFLDDLVMAHTVPFKGRLELSEPTVSLVDLTLSKLQIHELTRNDLIDLVILLAEHDFDDGSEGIDVGYLTALLARDWGFSYSATANLRAVRDAAGDLEGLDADTAALVADRADALTAAIDAEPKSSRWRMRARLGTRVRWYEDVQEVT